MFNRYTSDKLNPVFYKIVHQMTTTPVMPLLFVLEVLLNIGFFLGRECFVEQKDAVILFFSIYSYLATAQVLYFVYHEYAECRKDGLDPMWGTRLTPWKIIVGQYISLALLVLISVLLAVPVWVAAQPIFELNWTVLFWGIIALFSLGVFALGGSCQALVSNSGKGKSSVSIGVVAACLVVGLPVMGSLMNIAYFASQGSLSVYIEVFMILVPMLILVTAYRYGSLMPLSLEGYGLFRKLLLACILYALPCTVISVYIFGDEGDFLWNTCFCAYRIELIVFFAMYVFSVGFETMEPTYRRRIYAQKRGGIEWLTFPWQTGAVPGYLTAILLSLLLICITAPSMAQEYYGFAFFWLIFPLAGLVLLVRNCNRDKLPSWIVLFCVFAALFTVGVFIARSVCEFLDKMAKGNVYLFAAACYAIGTGLAFPAIKRYFSALGILPKKSGN